jgi:hypothetical protein
MDKVVKGDQAEQSYGWIKRLTEPVPNGETVVVPAPDFDYEYTDTRHTQVTAGSNVYKDGEGVAVAWKYSSASMQLGQEATVTNNTGAEWPLGVDVYVFCPHLLSSSDNVFDIKHQIYSLQQDIKDLTDRVTALEGVKS